MPDELTPTTNIEKFLAKTAGESVELPEPATRIEKYLNKIASEQTITEATDNWLDEHIDPSTGYVLDSTLTMNNAAPPASAVGDLKSAIKSVEGLLPTDKENNQNILIINNTKNGLPISLGFASQSGNRVYCGGKNLFDGTIGNYALDATTVLVSGTYRGFYVPVKGGITYTISRSSKSSSRFRIGETSDVPANGVALLGQPYVIDDSALAQTITTKSACKYLVVYLSNSSEDVSGTNFQCEVGNSATAFVSYDGDLQTTSDSSITMETAEGTTVAWCDSGDISGEWAIKIDIDKQLPVVNTNTSNTGNFSIVCAKERSYTDGTVPKIECFLIEEVGTKKFYFSQDLIEKTYAFTFNGDSEKYAFGVLQNGDVIACVLADALESGKSDSHRQNPYVWLASEKWETRHEVTFTGGAIPPCGWLENCGFKVLADGTAMFVEYTRMTVATANVWKLTGDPTNASNWSIKKSFEITTENNNTGFKHIHMVMQDFYTGIIYISTGDDDDNSMIWYTTDGGTTWTQLGTSSQKYCRNLNFIFTENYIYWVPDTTASSARYVFRAGRDANGVLDFANKEDYIEIGAYPETGSATVAAYGAAYIPELNAIFVLDRSDGLISSIPLKLALLDSAEVKTIGTLEAASGTMLVGFRTRFSEWYPHNGLMRFGFGLQKVGDFECTNKNKGFGNQGLSTTGAGAYNINNLIIRIYKNGDDYGFSMDTMY